MEIKKYIPNDEFRKTIEDKLISGQALKSILKTKRILPICTNNDSLANLVYKFFFGSELMTQIRDVMNFEQNNLKSTMMNVIPNYGEKEEFIDSFSELLVKSNLQRLPNSKYRLKNIDKKEDSISLQFSYDKFQKGKVELVSHKEVILDVEILATDDDEYRVSVLHEGISDSKQFFDFLERLSIANGKERNFYLKRITLSRLIKNNKVEFFDKFGKETHNDWKLIDITNITVNKNERCVEGEESDDDNEGEVKQTEAAGTLTGISSAILTGDKLLNNDFVKECMLQGFIFSSMRYKFEHKKEPLTIQIDVSFKQTDLKINMVKSTITEDDGNDYISSLSPNQQTKIINYFQNKAYKIYCDLLKSQESEDSVKVKV